MDKKSIKKAGLRTLSAFFATVGLGAALTVATKESNAIYYDGEQPGIEQPAPEEEQNNEIVIENNSSEQSSENTTENNSNEENTTDLSNEEEKTDTEEKKSDDTLVEDELITPEIQVKEEEAAPIAVKSVPVPVSDTLEFTEPTADNPLGELTNWNGFVFGDIQDGIDYEGSIAVGGSLTHTSSLSVNNGIPGLTSPSTDEITLLVNGDINVDGYGNVVGITATGQTTVTDYKASNTKSDGTVTNGEYITVNADDYFKKAAEVATNVNTSLAALSSNATYTNNGYGSFEFTGNPNETQLVYNVTESSLTGFNLDFQLEDNQTAVVNFTETSLLEFLNGSFSINGNSDNTYLRENASRITINIVASDVNFTSASLYGTFIAPNSNLTASGGNITGTVIINSLYGQNGFEFHVPTGGRLPIVTPTPPVTTPPVTTPPVTTPPVTTPPVTTPPVTTPPVTTPPVTTPPVTTPPVTTPPVTTPPPTPDIPSDYPKTGDETTILKGVAASTFLFAGAFGLGGIIDNKAEYATAGKSKVKRRRK